MRPAELHEVLAHLVDEVSGLRGVVAMLAGLELQEAWHGPEMSVQEREAVLEALARFVRTVAEADSVRERIEQQLRLNEVSQN